MTPRPTLEAVGILTMSACTLTFAALWWTAFLSGGAVQLTIVQYGERYPELALWFILTPVMLFSLYSYLNQLPDR